MSVTRFAIGVDIGGSNIRAVLGTSAGNLIEKVKAPIDKTSPEGSAKQVAELVQELVHKSGIVIDDLTGIGIGVPGAIVAEGRVWAPNLYGQQDFPLVTALRRFLQLPIPLFFENDRALAMLGEAWLGAARGVKNAIFLIIGTGVGAGLLINGKIYTGHSGVAGSVGWLIVDRDHHVEHLESKIAGSAIARQAIDQIRQGKASLILALANGDITAVTAETVTRAAARGDPEAQAILYKVGETIGLGIANIISILNPELVILGGGVGGNIFPLVCEVVQKTVEKWAQPIACQSVRIIRSALGDDAVVFGALRLALRGTNQLTKRENGNRLQKGR